MHPAYCEAVLYTSGAIVDIPSIEIALQFMKANYATREYLHCLSICVLQ